MSHFMWRDTSMSVAEWLGSLTRNHGSGAGTLARAEVKQEERAWGRRFTIQHLIHVYRKTGLVPSIQSVARVQFILDQTGQVVIPSLSVFLNTWTDCRIDAVCEVLIEIAEEDGYMDPARFSKDAKELAKNAVLMAQSKSAHLRLYRFLQRRGRGKYSAHLSQQPPTTMANIFLVVRERIKRTAAQYLLGDPSLPNETLPLLYTPLICV